MESGFASGGKRAPDYGGVTRGDPSFQSSLTRHPDDQSIGASGRAPGGGSSFGTYGGGIGADSDKSDGGGAKYDSLGNKKKGTDDGRSSTARAKSPYGGRGAESDGGLKHGSSGHKRRGTDDGHGSASSGHQSPRFGTSEYSHDGRGSGGRANSTSDSEKRRRGDLSGTEEDFRHGGQLGSMSDDEYRKQRGGGGDKDSRGIRSQRSGDSDFDDVSGRRSQGGSSAQTRDTTDAMNLAAAVGPLGSCHNVQTIIQSSAAMFIPKGQVFQETIRLPNGQRKTFAEAIDEGFFDVSSGSFHDQQTGGVLSLTDAASQGIVGKDMLKNLLKPCGLKNPTNGRDLSLLEAMRLKMFDPIAGLVNDPSVGVPLSLLDAVQKGLLSEEAAKRLSFVEISTKSTNLAYGFYRLHDYASVDLSLSLHDVIVKGLYDARTGKIIEPVTNEKVTLGEAISRKIVDASVREIVNASSSGSMMTVEEAIRRRILDAEAGAFFDVTTSSQLSLSEALEKGFISRPVLLHDALTTGLLDTDGMFKDIQTDRYGSMIVVYILVIYIW